MVTLEYRSLNHIYHIDIKENAMTLYLNSASKESEATLEEICTKIQLPKSQIEAAESRYESLGEWFNRSDSLSAIYEPHIFPQGSFRLGTAIRPATNNDDFDLDLACKLDRYPDNCSQNDLRNAISEELSKYIKANNIQSELEEKRRCSRIPYAPKSGLGFHLDIVPCKPRGSDFTATLSASLESYHSSINENFNENDRRLYESVASKAVAITDTEDKGYHEVDTEWPSSNPEGYAEWFDNKSTRFTKVAMEAKVDPVPDASTERTPLQKAIQLLKRHRDVMFEMNQDFNSKSKPVSIIITTLVAQSYQHTDSLEATLENALNTLDSFISDTSSPKQVINPLDPNENFADKWQENEGKELKLEESFRAWVKQARRDFNYILSKHDNIKEIIKKRFAVDISDELCKEISSQPSRDTIKVTAAIPIITTNRPWRKV